MLCQVRGVDALNGPDTTPWTEVWRVDVQTPTVTLVVKPSAQSDTPASTALFVVASSAPHEVRLWYRYGAVASGVGVWTHVSGASGVIELVDLEPGVTYTMDVYGVDVVGNVGLPISWSWVSGTCAGPSDAPLHNLASYPLDYGERVVVWDGVNSTAVTKFDGYEYSLDGGVVWTETGSPFVILTGLAKARCCDDCW